MAMCKHFDKYLPSVLIQDADDKRAWYCGTYTCCTSLEEAMKVIEKQKENHTVLCAWIHKERVSVFKQPVFFECYVNTLGQVNGRFIGKEYER